MAEKISLAKLNQMKKAAQEAKEETADLTYSPTDKRKTKAVQEKRTDKIGTYLRPSEKEKFLSLIGRKSESDAVRELILTFIKKDDGVE